MVADELLDEDAFDKEKLFNEEEYSTLVIDRDGFSGKQNSAADLIEALLEPHNSRAEKEELFKKLKSANDTKLLVKAIGEAKRNSEKATLISACWECGLDFTPHFSFFAQLVANPDFNVALEALSVIESCEGKMDERVLKQLLSEAQQSKSPNQELINDLTKNIKARFNL